MLAERLLRRVFDDRRTEWGGISRAWLKPDGSRPQVDLYQAALRTVGKLILWKIFPFLRKRTIRKHSGGIPKIDYWGLKGTAPELLAKLNGEQRTVLTAFAAKPELWTFRTNLWELFGLPGTPAELRAFIAART